MRADVQKIFLATPRLKQVMMFSATMPEPIRLVARKFMTDVRTASHCCSLSLARAR